ncbi:unnamed protein product [Clonostachys rosea]|uniref:Nucleoside phosphorylase domain-containing protein n=1 Tax=Bionectria ochroleuca TaxID=29856 RepID=A0ABY6V4E3_BIOOC|nr:unnamed protein product [Clonostachys rosea]
MSATMPPENNTFMVAWITSNSDQTVASKAFFDERYRHVIKKAAGDSNQYALGKMGRHNVVLTELPEGENKIPLSAAAEVMSNMIRTFDQIRVALFVGTGSGVNSDDHCIRLGDVVVSLNGAFQFNYDAAVGRMAFQGTESTVCAPACVRAAVRELTSRYVIETNPLGRAIPRTLDNSPSLKERSTFQRPGDEFDRLYKAFFNHVRLVNQYCYQSCGNDAAHVEYRPPVGDYEDCPAVHHGSIASAYKPIRDPRLRDQLAAENSVLCFDTEAAGLLGTFPYLLIRGITDYADTHSSPKWRGYAAAAAAAYSRHLLHVLSDQDVREEPTLQVYAERKAAKDGASSTTDKPTAGDVPPLPKPQNTQYKPMIGYFLQTEIDAAIRRDRKGLEADLIKLVGINSDIVGYGDKWKPLILEVEQFQRKWQITQPLVREGRKVVQGHKLEDWQRTRQDGALSKQMRFFAAHNELLAFSNGTVFDRDTGYGSFQCCLWSVWRTMEYMGIAEDVKL